MKEETERWWDKSQEDLKTAEILIENDRFPEGAFFLQQSIEKALKSLLIEEKDEFPKIHDLVSLGKRVDAPSEILDYCKEISPAYTYARYPDVVESSEIDEKIKDFTAWTREVLEWVKERI